MFNTDSLASEVAHSGAGPADLSVGQLAVPRSITVWPGLS